MPVRPSRCPSLGALACAFVGLCYAEMASTVSVSGSAYTYAYATIGELIAWIIGWDLIPESASATHPRFRTPDMATIGIRVVVCGFAVVLPIGLVGELVNIGTLLAFTAVCIGVLTLRIKHPDQKRPFKAPAIWFTAPADALVSFILMLGLPLDTWIRLAVWLAIGLAIYTFYGRHHSKASRHDSSERIPQQHRALRA